jgi:hypothetical protein
MLRPCSPGKQIPLPSQAVTTINTGHALATARPHTALLGKRIRDQPGINHDHRQRAGMPSCMTSAKQATSRKPLGPKLTLLEVRLRRPIPCPRQTGTPRGPSGNPQSLRKTWALIGTFQDDSGPLRCASENGQAQSDQPGGSLKILDRGFHPPSLLQETRNGGSHPRVAENDTRPVFGPFWPVFGKDAFRRKIRNPGWGRLS